MARGGPFHARDHARFEAEPGVVEDLGVEQGGFERYPLALPVGGGTCAGDGGGDAGAVAEMVARVGGVREVGLAGKVTGQVRMCRVDAAVEDRDGDAGAGQAGLPGGRCADLGQVGVQVGGVDPPVQPDAAHPRQRPGPGTQRRGGRGAMRRMCARLGGGQHGASGSPRPPRGHR